MSAAIALQSAVVARLSMSKGLHGVFLDVPARAAFPYVVVHCADERDWSCSGRQGREVVLHIALWDLEPSRLVAVEGELERQLQGIETGAPWHLSTLVLVGKRRTRDPAHPWSCVFEFRARLIENAKGAAA